MIVIITMIFGYHNRKSYIDYFWWTLSKSSFLGSIVALDHYYFYVMLASNAPNENLGTLTLSRSHDVNQSVMTCVIAGGGCIGNGNHSRNHERSLLFEIYGMPLTDEAKHKQRTNRRIKLLLSWLPLEKETQTKHKKCLVPRFKPSVKLVYS